MIPCTSDTVIRGASWHHSTRTVKSKERVGQARRARIHLHILLRAELLLVLLFQQPLQLLYAVLRTRHTALCQNQEQWSLADGRASTLRAARRACSSQVMLARTSMYDHPVSSSIGRLSFISAEGASSAGAAASCALRFFPMVATQAAPRLLRGALQCCARFALTHALAWMFKFLPATWLWQSSYECEALAGTDGGIKALSKEVL